MLDLQVKPEVILRGETPKVESAACRFGCPSLVLNSSRAYLSKIERSRSKMPQDQKSNVMILIAFQIKACLIVSKQSSPRHFASLVATRHSIYPSSRPEMPTCQRFGDIIVSAILRILSHDDRSTQNGWWLSAIEHGMPLARSSALDHHCEPHIIAGIEMERRVNGAILLQEGCRMRLSAWPPVALEDRTSPILIRPYRLQSQNLVGSGVNGIMGDTRQKMRWTQGFCYGSGGQEISPPTSRPHHPNGST
nr:hypothetical protein CFP56_31793 [Quercus suber]